MISAGPGPRRDRDLHILTVHKERMPYEDKNISLAAAGGAYPVLTQVVLFPFAMGFTYAGRNESPHHVLTYTTGSLTWNSATGVDPDTGVAELSLFSDHYQNVQSDNGEKVVAPGTENTNIVRLKNSVSRTITYVAVMYRIKSANKKSIGR